MSRYYIGSWSYYVAMYNSWDIIWESGRGRGKGEGEGRGKGEGRGSEGCIP